MGLGRSSQEAVERQLLHLLHGRKTRNHLTEIHAHFLRHHLHHSNKLLSHFVSICSSLNKMHYADLLFRQVQHPNILLYNAMIKGFSLCGPFEDSVHYFIGLKNRGIWPDEFTFAPLLKTCANLVDIKLGEGVHKDVIVLGFERFAAIRVGVVEHYVNCKKMMDARKAFDEMSNRDVILWNLMIRGYCSNNYLEVGFRLFKEMDQRTVVSWNTMISCLANGGRDREALALYHEMLEDGFEPDEATVVTVLPVCARLKEVEEGKRIHAFVELNGLLADFVSVGTALVDFYCKFGDSDTAYMIFNNLPRKNIVSCNAMIAGFGLTGKGDLGVKLFDDMMKKCLSPNDSTFVAVLTCCVHKGLLEQGKHLFSSMTMKHGLQPKIEHYGCMVNLLGRNGCLEEAFDMIQSMPMMPNAALWGALLSACRSHGDMELAKCALKELINLEPWNSGNYVLLSNIFAKQGDWDNVEGLRVLMKENCVQKTPGHSSI